MTPLRPLVFPFVAADGKDDPGVLGNLPRSRPGRRSDKRSSASSARTQSTSAKPSTKARASATSQRAKRSTGGRAASRSQPAAKTSAPSTRAEEQRAAQSSGGSDPISSAVRLAGKVAETGVKTAVGIIKRLPGAPR